MYTYSFTIIVYAKFVGAFVTENDPKNESGNCLVVMFSRQVWSCSQKIYSNTPSKSVSTYPMDAILNTLDDITF